MYIRTYVDTDVHTCTCTQVRDLVSWMHNAEEMISDEEPARSVSEAEALISRHSEHKAEIDARESSVAQVTKSGKKLIQQNHYASTEVRTCFIVNEGRETQPPVNPLGSIMTVKISHKTM